MDKRDKAQAGDVFGQRLEWRVGFQNWAERVSKQIICGLISTPHPALSSLKNDFSLTTLIRPAAALTRSRERRMRGEGELFCGTLTQGIRCAQIPG
jgi:hypothetical protein